LVNPEQVLEDASPYPECGENGKVFKYRFYKTALILRLEDSLVVGFDSSGGHCYSKRSSIKIEQINCLL